MMKRSQIYLPVEQWRRLSALSSQVHEPVSELIRRAIERTYKGAGHVSFRQSLERAAGLWRDRRDLGPTGAHARALRRGRRLDRLFGKADA